MNITEFLEARITEDEAVAKKAAASISPAMDTSREPVGPAWEDAEGMILGQPDKDGYPIPLWDNEGSSTLSMDPDASAHVARHDPARVLAECAAKRAIIEEHYWRSAEGQRGCGLCNYDRDYGWEDTGPCKTVRALVAVYADHPDYQQEWV